jgi:hypothetical protein
LPAAARRRACHEWLEVNDKGRGQEKMSFPDLCLVQSLLGIPILTLTGHLLAFAPAYLPHRSRMGAQTGEAIASGRSPAQTGEAIASGGTPPGEAIDQAPAAS